MSIESITIIEDGLSQYRWLTIDRWDPMIRDPHGVGLMQLADLLAIGTRPPVRTQYATRIAKGQQCSMVTEADGMQTICRHMPRRRTLSRSQRSERSPLSQPEPVQETPTEDENDVWTAITLNGWFPSDPPPCPKRYYLDPKEIFYFACKVHQAGGVGYATDRCEVVRNGQIIFKGTDGDRFAELVYLLARNYLGRIAFRDNGDMANLADDLVHEAATKCILVAHRFRPWGKPKGKHQTRSIANAFAYFTMVVRNKMYEVLDSPLSGMKNVYLEDLRCENQSVTDLF